jgi:lipoyl-dependent peroxiredoxin
MGCRRWVVVPMQVGAHEGVKGEGRCVCGVRSSQRGRQALRVADVLGPSSRPSGRPSPGLGVDQQPTSRARIRWSKEDPMAAVQRTAELHWTGSIARGSGRASGGSGGHAACSTMTLGLILPAQRTPPEQLQVTATVTLETSGTPTIASSRLEVHGVVPRAHAASFERQLMRLNGAARSPELSRAMSRSVCRPCWTSRLRLGCRRPSRLVAMAACCMTA